MWDLAHIIIPSRLLYNVEGTPTQWQKTIFLGPGMTRTPVMYFMQIMLSLRDLSATSAPNLYFHDGIFISAAGL